MGFLGSMFNGAQGAGFQAQGAGNLQQPFTADQVTGAMGGTNAALTQQQQLAAALGGAGGIQNQSNTYNALGQTAAQLQPGIQQLGGLANQYQGIANGTGPNPAQAMLAQATGNNVAQQAALAAGQRGAGANVGLMERNAALAGSNAQQQAAGQGATLQANQSLNALGQVGNALGQQANLIGQQGTLQGMQGSIAGQQVGNQMAGTGAVTNAALANQGQLTQGLGAQNTANIQNAAQQNSANAGVAAHNAQSQAQGIGGLFNSLGPAASVLGGLFGGGGAAAGADALSGSLAAVPELTLPALGSAAGIGSGAGAASLLPLALKYKGGEIGGSALAPHLQAISSIYHGQTKQPLAQGGPVMLKQGGGVPGQPKQPEKDVKTNDTVPALLTPKEVVLPLSVTQSKDPVKAAAEFMASVLKKQGKGGDPAGDFKAALQRAVKNRKAK